MSVYLWAKSRSWHLTPTVLPADHRAGTIRTLCGREVSDVMAREVEPPAGDRTCERCFQIRESRAFGDLSRH